MGKRESNQFHFVYYRRRRPATRYTVQTRKWKNSLILRCKKDEEEDEEQDEEGRK